MMSVLQQPGAACQRLSQRSVSVQTLQQQDVNLLDEDENNLSPEQLKDRVILMRLSQK